MQGGVFAATNIGISDYYIKPPILMGKTIGLNLELLTTKWHSKLQITNLSVLGILPHASSVKCHCVSNDNEFLHVQWGCFGQLLTTRYILWADDINFSTNRHRLKHCDTLLTYWCIWYLRFLTCHLVIHNTKLNLVSIFLTLMYINSLTLIFVKPQLHSIDNNLPKGKMRS